MNKKKHKNCSHQQKPGHLRLLPKMTCGSVVGHSDWGTTYLLLQGVTTKEAVPQQLPLTTLGRGFRHCSCWHTCTKLGGGSALRSVQAAK